MPGKAVQYNESPVSVRAGVIQRRGRLISSHGSAFLGWFDQWPFRRPSYQRRFRPSLHA